MKREALIVQSDKIRGLDVPPPLKHLTTSHFFLRLSDW